MHEMGPQRPKHIFDDQFYLKNVAKLRLHLFIHVLPSLVWVLRDPEGEQNLQFFVDLIHFRQIYDIMYFLA